MLPQTFFLSYLPILDVLEQVKTVTRFERAFSTPVCYGFTITLTLNWGATAGRATEVVGTENEHWWLSVTALRAVFFGLVVLPSNFYASALSFVSNLEKTYWTEKVNSNSIIYKEPIIASNLAEPSFRQWRPRTKIQNRVKLLFITIHRNRNI